CLGQDPALFEIHVHPADRQEGAGSADNRGHGAAVGGGGANRGGRGLREHGVAGDEATQKHPDQAETEQPGARAREPEAPPKLWHWFERASLPHQTFLVAFVSIIFECPLRSPGRIGLEVAQRYVSCNQLSIAWTREDE